MATTLETQQEVNATGKTAYQVEKDELLDALLFCAKVVQKTSAIPLLSCIKFDLKEDKLVVTAMDTTQAVIRMLNVHNDQGENGSYLLPAREAIDLVKKLPTGPISFLQNDSTVSITYGARGKANLVALSSEEYPELPQLKKTPFLSMPIEVLRKGALASRFTVTDQNTPTLTAICIANENGKLVFTGTDRHRIYKYTSEITVNKPLNNALVPAAHFRGIVDLIKSPTVELGIGSTHAVIRDRNTIYFGRMLEGKYPDMAPIFSQRKEGVAVKVPRGEMDDTLNRMLSLDGVENNRVTLEVKDEEFTIHSHSQTGEICEGFPDAQADEGFPTVKFNARYLKEALLAGDREASNVTVRTKAIGMPGFIEFDGDDSVTVVVNQLR